MRWPRAGQTSAQALNATSPGARTERRTRLAAILLVLASAAANAQIPGALSAGSGETRISARDRLEWLPERRAFEATGDVVIARDGLELRAARVTATYPGDDPGDVTQVAARGDEADPLVTIATQAGRAQAPRADWDRAAGTITLAGPPRPTIVRGEDTLVADRITAHLTEDAAGTRLDRVVAAGGAEARQGERQVRAATLTARYRTKADGTTDLERIDGAGGVTITSKADSITGREGTYLAGENRAMVTGDVEIRRGDTEFRGPAAEIDLATGRARLFAPAGTGRGTRVEGVFSTRLPAGEDDDDDGAAPVTP